MEVVCKEMKAAFAYLTRNVLADGFLFIRERERKKQDNSFKIII